VSVCLPDWVFITTLLVIGARGVLRDLVEHDGLRGLLSGSSGSGRGEDREKS
jgi:hypothetical protein